MAPVLPHLAEEIYEHDVSRHSFDNGKTDTMFKQGWPVMVSFICVFIYL